MAIRAMTLGDTFEYVSEKDPCKVKQETQIDPKDASKGNIIDWHVKEGATKFFLAALDLFLMGHIYDNSQAITGTPGSAQIGITTRMNQTNIDTVRFGLRGFENFKDAKGNDIKFTTTDIQLNNRDYKVASDEVLKNLGIRLVAELAGKIKEASEVSSGDEKNFVEVSSRAA
jgi:hypothetical protein